MPQVVSDTSFNDKPTATVRMEAVVSVQRLINPIRLLVEEAAVQRYNPITKLFV